MKYIYTVRLNGGAVVKFNTGGRILEGFETYESLPHDIKKFVSPYHEILRRGLDKGAIEAFTVELDPTE